MKVTDLLRGKRVSVMTDAKVAVQLDIESVEEIINSNLDESNIYEVKFTNGFIKSYSSLNDIDLYEESNINGSSHTVEIKKLKEYDLVIFKKARGKGIVLNRKRYKVFNVKNPGLIVGTFSIVDDCDRERAILKSDAAYKIEIV